MDGPAIRMTGALWSLARSGDFREALGRASAALEGARGADTRADLHLLCACCEMRLGAHGDAADHLDRAQAVAKGAAASHVATWRAELAYVEADYSRALRLVEDVLEGLVARADWQYAAFAMRIRIAVHLAHANYEAIAAIEDRAVRYAEAAGDNYVKVQVYNVLGAFHFDAATASLPRHARSHLTAIEPAEAEPLRREAREALRYFEHARSAAQQSGYTFAAWYVSGNIERLQILLGHAERVLRPMRMRLKQMQKRGARHDEIVVRSNLAWALRTLGRHGDALHELDVALDLTAQDAGGDVLLEFLYYDRSLVLEALGQAERARNDYNRYVRLVHTSRRKAAAPGATGGAPPLPIEPHFLKRADRFIAANLRHRFTMRELAAHCAVSWRTLDKAFVVYRGVTPVAQVRNLRLDAARRELDETGCSVAEAAARSGFRSVTTFSLEYRKRFGMPPSRPRGSRPQRPARRSESGSAR